MKLVAVNGNKFGGNILKDAVKAAKNGTQPIELLVDTGDYFRVISVPYFDGPRYPHLTRIEARPDTLTEVLKHRT